MYPLLTLNVTMASGMSKQPLTALAVPACYYYFLVQPLFCSQPTASFNSNLLLAFDNAFNSTHVWTLSAPLPLAILTLLTPFPLPLLCHFCVVTDTNPIACNPSPNSYNHGPFPSPMHLCFTGQGGRITTLCDIQILTGKKAKSHQVHHPVCLFWLWKQTPEHGLCWFPLCHPQIENPIDPSHSCCQPHWLH